MNWRYLIAAYRDELAWAFDRLVIWITKKWEGGK